MGIPTWANESASGTDAANRGPKPFNRWYPNSTEYSRVKFPVNKIENSPTLSGHGTDDVQTRTPMVIPFPHQAEVPAFCQPDQVVFHIKREFQSDSKNPWCDSNHAHKMVTLEPLDQVKEIEVQNRIPNKTNLIPTATKVMVEEPKQWYTQFSRNIHGLKRDMPYNNLQWPPKGN
ncbi:hypothetical protein TCAL_05468 [Tigriopus californicus]|uniref:Uncharacterized protein n=2 Tax=Tigriopus californicus TaxID=6832 RepID=A0A553P5U4_TIGCA|nr:uncharacterized protein LOC131877599 isoform X2 [Tigriopus californicus]TRY73056.1 hypothetical protein TCAL_05468 [Tigriopus californicus]|eukprot:TCALIF_05468-PA protein Name:"Protein of unknown function" AED:0.00 eAED:0.00 QI:124/1/1/1/0.5/0.66/3/9/174